MWLSNRRYQTRAKVEIVKFFDNESTPNNSIIQDHITLLNTSRNREILELMLKAIRSNKHRYRTKIILRRDTSNHPVTGSWIAYDCYPSCIYLETDLIHHVYTNITITTWFYFCCTQAADLAIRIYQDIFYREYNRSRIQWLYYRHRKSLSRR